MKRLLMLLLFAMVPGSAAMAQLPANVLEGTWRLVSQRSIYPDTIIVTTNPPPSIKILNSTHFSWGYQAAVGDEVIAGGGRYTLEETDSGNLIYTEHLEYHVTELLVGQTLEFAVTIVGDLWYHAGEFPSGYRLEEVWSRIE